MDKIIRKRYYDQLVEEIYKSGFDAIVISPSEELQFFTGFSPMMCERFQGLFVLKDGNCFYFCNLLYRDQVADAYGDQIPVYTWFDGDSMLDKLKMILEKYHLIGTKMLVNQSAQAFNILDVQDAFQIEFHSGKETLEKVRICKTGAELDALRYSAKIADQAFSDVLNFIRPGITEGDILRHLFSYMEEHGGYDCGGLVASGPNASYPHYDDDKRIIQEKDVIILDYGCHYQGMNSDMSRTVFVGRPTDEQIKVYDIVNQSQLAGQAMVKEGAYIPDIDRAARKVIEDAGYGDFFPYRLGHGIGYMVHEAPYIHGNNHMNLKKGMAFSIEPGIYLPANFGIRIENIVIVNEQGECDILNQSDRNPIIL